MHIAVRTARAVAKRLMDRFEHRYELAPRKKANNELVSDADTETESAIIQLLKSAYPSYQILGEESGGSLPGRGFCWIIDPIDGTANFLSGVPHFAISIALAENGKVIGGLIYDPTRDEMFAGENGRGAFLNEYRIRVGKNRLLDECLLATSFPHQDKEQLTNYLKGFNPLFAACQDVRRQGSAALDLAYVAAGRYDGFWEGGLKRWDIAAGAVILQEAGGYITDFIGKSAYMDNGEVVAANPAIHALMLEKISLTTNRKRKTVLKLNK